MNEINSLQLLTIVIFTFMGFYIILREDKKNMMSVKQLTFFEIMDIIDSIIDTYLAYKVKLDFDVRRDGTIIDFELELKTIVNDIVIHLSLNIISQSELYVSDTYLIEYISNKVQLFLLQKMKEDNKKR